MNFYCMNFYYYIYLIKHFCLNFFFFAILVPNFGFKNVRFYSDKNFSLKKFTLNSAMIISDAIYGFGYNVPCKNF